MDAQVAYAGILRSETMSTTLRTYKISPSKPLPTLRRDRDGLLRRACGGNTSFDGQCQECRKKKLQRKALNSETSSQPSAFNSQLSDVPTIVREVLRLPGQPLDVQRAPSSSRASDTISVECVFTLMQKRANQRAP